MIRYFARIYDTKKNEQFDTTATSKDDLYEEVNEVIKGCDLNNISVEFCTVDTEKDKGENVIDSFIWHGKMADLKNYKNIIKEIVKKVDEEDDGWKWKVKNIDKHQVEIYWEYLGECNGEKDSFIVTLQHDRIVDFKEPNYQILVGRNPDGSRIHGELVTEGEPDRYGIEIKVEDGLKNVIRSIAAYAHHCY